MSEIYTEQYIKRQDFYRISALSALRQNYSEIGYGFMKRLFDIIFSFAALIFFSPIFIIIPVLIKLDSRGSVFIIQRRVGKDGKVFGILKFRSMNGGVGYDYSPKNSGDKRITKIGKFLRKSGIDEIPQFINVLMGEMSIVGPRPEMEFIVEKYNHIQKRRLAVKPGITGLWQIKGDRKKLIHENIGYDLSYINKRSFWLDMAIMFETALFMIKCIKK